MKRFLGLVLGLLFVLSAFTGFAQTAPIEITFASFNSGNAVGNQAVIKFAEIVEDRSGGRLVVNFFPDSVLGNEIENLQQIKTNEIQMCYFGDNFGNQLAAEYDPTVVPFIFQSVDDVRKVYESDELGKLIDETAKQRGNVYLIALNNRAPRNLTAKRAINTPSDLKGLKIRVPEIPSWVTVWNSIGAMSTVVSWAETYSALQTGVVDGQENPIDNIFVNKIYEVNDHIMLTEHLQAVWHWCVNVDFFDKLDTELQEILVDSAKEACLYGDEVLQKNIDEMLNEMIKLGIKVVEVDKGLFSNAATKGIEDVSIQWAPETVAYVEKYLSGIGK